MSLGQAGTCSILEFSSPMWEFLKGTPIPDQSWEIRHGSPHFYGRFGGLLVAEWISQSHSNLGFDLAAKQSILTSFCDNYFCVLLARLTQIKLRLFQWENYMR